MTVVKHGFTVDQIIEEGRISIEQVNSIKLWLATEENLQLNDEQIVLFSLSCSNDLEATKATIKSFRSTRNTYPALFTNRKVHLHALHQQLQVAQFCVLRKRTGDGCTVVYARLQDSNFLHFDIEKCAKLLFMTLDAAVHDYPPQGLIVLFDMTGIGLLHLTRVKLGVVQAFFQYLQECLPVRLNSIHVLNSVNFLEKVINIIKPFINKELMDRLHFHPRNLNMEVFYQKYLPKECLPEEYGGYLESVPNLHMKNIDKLRFMEAYFDAEEDQRCVP